MLHLYAVAAADSAADVPRGLRILREGRVATVFEELRQPPEAEAPAVRRFGEAVVALSDATTVLPIRFGTTVDDDSALRRLVRDNEERWLASLDRVAGQAELIVHWEGDSPKPSSQAGSGYDYLMSRVSSSRLDATIVDRLTSALAPHCTDFRRLDRGAPHRLACLAPRAAEAAVRDACDRLSGDVGRAFRVTGPWPPFSFSDDPEGAGECRNGR